MDRVLVGREAECTALRDALAGRPPVILVAGEGGAGKTTLVERVLASAGPAVLSGRAGAGRARADHARTGGAAS
jgi:predicted ATPase